LTRVFDNVGGSTVKVDDFDYFLPENLIAQKPVQNRDESRLMVLNKKNGEIKEQLFKDIISYMNPGDLLVLNNSRVIPARLYGKKIPTGAEIEVLLLKEEREGIWEVLVRPGRRVKKGIEISFGEGKLKGKTLDYTEFGGRIMEFKYKGNFYNILNELGEMPLPPYINSKLEDSERYQTVYANIKGSVAAPTAGLHFTSELLKKIKDKGIIIASITLHVGLGTFRPVKVNRLEDHIMHSEYYEISPDIVEKIRITRENGNRIIAVGTTVTRALEAAAGKNGKIRALHGWTDIFIYPGYQFKVIDRLITNFHLPKSTLLMLVSAFAGNDNILNAYKKAVRDKYRFFSLGDAMFII
jgi:S-adenosylmethionine:tRNA ribosyltransferase-isomerase